MNNLAVNIGFYVETKRFCLFLKKNPGTPASFQGQVRTKNTFPFFLQEVGFIKNKFNFVPLPQPYPVISDNHETETKRILPDPACSDAYITRRYC